MNALRKIKDIKIQVVLALTIIVIGILLIELGFHWVTLVVTLVVLLLSLQIYILLQERRIMENESKNIQLLKNQNENFIDNIPIAVCFLIKGKISYANEEAIKMFGANNLAEIEGQSIFNYIPREFWEPITMEETLSKHKSGGSKGNAIGLLNKGNGETIDIQLQYEHLFLQNTWGYGVVIKDITDLKNSEKQLQHSEQLSVIGELAAGVAHEIRNPLTSLKGFIQLISHESKEASTYQEIMTSELERINLIVNELLLLAKPKEADYESKHLLSLVKTVVTIANTQAILYNIQIKLVYNEEIDKVYIECEENKLKQVFLNVLKNAIEAMEKEGDIYIKFKKLGDRIIMQFIDEGPGISKDKLANLGKRFYTTKQDGTGLGLMISKNIVREHKGDMDITSEVGVGTKVEISLPLKSSSS
ncbi:MULTISPECIES: ATP-binding protein [Bacillaceae]|uniref:histidine kinase n=1 Tax=Evansella alkalicola TaxID=745819 RepID=A0ABS6JNY8_9BACI|nr:MULTISPECIES: ATP-binding protein [Bacillaceae]MBU9719977.1 PAS domain-containing protein [Bacillus alkalicola]